MAREARKGQTMATVSRSDQTTNALKITLIVTVVLLFVLAVLCYFVFSWWSDTSVELETTTQQLGTVQRDLTQQSTAVTQLKQMLGFEESKPMEEIDTETKQAFDSEYADFREEADDYSALAKALLEQIRKKDDALFQERSNREAAERARQSAEQELRDAKTSAAREVQDRSDDFARVESDFNRRRLAFEKQQEDLSQAQQIAQDRATALSNVMKTLENGESLISSQRQERYREASTDPSAQVTLLYDELKDQVEQLAEKNKLIVALGAASRDVQDYLLRSLPQADRVDRFDGRVVAIDEVNGTVDISSPATMGLRPGLVFRVYSGDDPTPLWSSTKGTLEVISSNAGRVRARIRQESMRNPIIVGDGVATPLWSPGLPLDVVIVGFVRLDQDRQEDLEELVTIVERAGGRVSSNVEVSTTILVDAGRPVSRGGDSSREPIFREDDEKRRNEQIRRAQDLAIRTVPLDVFLDWLGIDLETRKSGVSVDIPGARLSRDEASAASMP